jgi:hypothetical protein
MRSGLEKTAIARLQRNCSSALDRYIDRAKKTCDCMKKVDDLPLSAEDLAFLLPRRKKETYRLRRVPQSATEALAQANRATNNLNLTSAGVRLRIIGSLRSGLRYSALMEVRTVLKPAYCAGAVLTESCTPGQGGLKHYVSS